MLFLNLYHSSLSPACSFSKGECCKFLLAYLGTKEILYLEMLGRISLEPGSVSGRKFVGGRSGTLYWGSAYWKFEPFKINIRFLPVMSSNFTLLRIRSAARLSIFHSFSCVSLERCSLLFTKWMLADYAFTKDWNRTRTARDIVLSVNGHGFSIAALVWILIWPNGSEGS